MKKILSAVLACAATMSLATCAFADEAPATAPGATEEAPGATEDAPVVINVELTVGKDGIEGAALNDQLLVKDDTKYTWADVEEVSFVSEGLFSVGFSANEEIANVKWFTLGVNEVPSVKADEDAEWANSWALDSELIALFDTTKEDGGYVKVAGKEDDTKVTATVTIKADAEGKPVDPENKDTGIALAVAPAALAVAFVSVAAVMSKKKKG